MADQSRLSVYLLALGAFALGMASYVTSWAYSTYRRRF